MRSNYFKIVCLNGLTICALAGIITLAGCNSLQVQSFWSARPMEVDGQMTEWADMPTTYFEDQGVLLGLSNDAENLYILFRLNDPDRARSIRMEGVTLWLDTSGKKKRDFGIRYAGSPPSGMKEPEAPVEGGFWNALTPEQKDRLRERQAAMADHVIVIDQKREMSVPADGSRGLAGNSASSHGMYTYELRVPLKKSDINRYGIGAQPGQAISLGLELGGMNAEDGKKMMGKMGGGPPDGGTSGGFPGGGMGGGRSGPPDSHKQPTEKMEVWVKIVLALPPTGQG